MTRLGALESLIKSIRTQPQEDAEKLFHRIRGTTHGSDLAIKTLIESGSHDDADSVPNHANFFSFGNSASPPIDPDLDSICTTQSPVLSDKTSNIDGFPPSEIPSRKDTLLAEISLPDRPILVKATAAFFYSSLQPFHVFSRNEVDRLLHIVYPDLNSPQVHNHAAIASLAAVAAVGARYHQAKLDEDTSRALYDLAQHCFDKVIDTQPLDAIKCCVLLAMYNFMARSTVALVYVGA